MYNDMPGYSDPMASIDQRLRRINSIISTGNPNAGIPRQGQYPPLSPQEEDSISSSIGSGITSGLSFIGNVLGTPGAFITTALSGNDPFPGIFDPEQRKYGRDVLENWGVLGDNQEGLDAGDVAGFGLDLLADPLTYMTAGAGAYSKLGKAAKAAGALPTTGKARAATTFADLLTEHAGTATESALRRAATKAGITEAEYGGKLGGNIGINTLGIPGLMESKPIAQGVINFDPALELLGKIPGAKYVGNKIDELDRWRNRVFDASARDAVTREGQQVGRDITNDAFNRTANDLVEIKDLYSQSGLSNATDEERSLFRRYMEDAAEPGVADRVNVAEGVPDGFQKHGSILQDSDVDQRWVPVKQRILAALKNAEQDKIRTGQLAKGLTDVVGYFPRSLTGVVWDEVENGRRVAFDARHAANMARKDYLKGFQGGTSELQSIAKEVYSSGLSKRKEIRDYLEGLGHWKTPEELDDAADMFYMTNREALKMGGFANHPFADLTNYIKGHNEATAAAEHTLKWMAKNLVADAADGTTVPVASVIRKMHLRIGGAADFLTESHPAYQQFMSQALGVATHKDLANVVKTMHVPKEVADDITRLVRGFQRPEVASKLLSGFDSFTSLWKGGVLGVWPSYHVRNMVSGLWNNYVGGVFSGESLKDATKLVKGELSDAPLRYLAEAGIHPPSQLAGKARIEWGKTKLWDILESHGLVGNSSLNDINSLGKGFEDVTYNLPGQRPFRFIESLKKAVPRQVGGSAESMNPTKVRGWMGAEHAKFGPAAAGEDISWATDAILKTSGFLKQLKEGVDIPTAVKRMKALQVDYAASALTPVEKQWFRRMFPFYSFTKGMMPTALRELAEKPGGVMAKSLRLSAQARRDQGPLPNSVTSGLTIPSPLGSPLQDGTKNYISSLGLMYEDPLSLLQVGDTPFDTLKKSSSQILGRLNPVAKIPIELATNRLLFSQGRDIQEADPAVGRLMTNIFRPKGSAPVRVGEGVEYLLNSVPYAGRSASTANNLLDERKGVIERLFNVGTGFKTTSVSPALQRVVIQDRIKELMRQNGGRVLERAYIPEAVRDQMSDEELSFIDRIQALNRLQDARRRDARK